MRAFRKKEKVSYSRGWFVHMPRYVHVPLEATCTSQKTEYVHIPRTLNQRPQELGILRVLELLSSSPVKIPGL